METPISEMSELPPPPHTLAPVETSEVTIIIMREKGSIQASHEVSLVS